MTVSVRFEHPPARLRTGEMGPFPFVQLICDELRAGPRGHVIAYYNRLSGLWTVPGGDQAESSYSDVVITPIGAVAQANGRTHAAEAGRSGSRGNGH